MFVLSVLILSWLVAEEVSEDSSLAEALNLGHSLIESAQVIIVSFIQNRDDIGLFRPR